MRMLRIAVAVALFALGACSDDKKEPPADAPTIDAPAADAAVDAPPGATCTGAVYDPCTSNTQCTTNDCHLYSAQGLQVCTQACTPGDNTTCPIDKTGARGTCNNMGNCKPAAANDCTR